LDGSEIGYGSVGGQDSYEPHIAQLDRSLLVGRFNEQGDTYPFFGNISQLAIVHLKGNPTTSNSATIVDQLKDFKKVKETDGLVALYTLEDAVDEVHHC